MFLSCTRTSPPTLPSVRHLFSLRDTFLSDGVSFLFSSLPSCFLFQFFFEKKNRPFLVWFVEWFRERGFFLWFQPQTCLKTNNSLSLKRQQPNLAKGKKKRGSFFSIKKGEQIPPFNKLAPLPPYPPPLQKQPKGIIVHEEKKKRGVFFCIYFAFVQSKVA